MSNGLSKRTVLSSNSRSKPPAGAPRANVLGVGVHALNLTGAVELLEHCVTEGRRGYVCVTGVHGVMEAHRNPKFLEILDRALLVVPDGMPTVWIGKLQGQYQMSRVFGPDLMLELFRRSQQNGLTHFLYGGKPGVAEELRNQFERRFPGIKVVGTFTPPFRPLLPSEQGELRNNLARLVPDILWVGLSTPKQEVFMAENIGQVACRLMIGVGAAFDIHTGRLRDAPAWMKEAGLQWAHRLYQEPSRLWRRYLVNNSGFLLHSALQLTGISRYTLSRERRCR